MYPLKITDVKTIHLVGLKIETSLAKNETQTLWRSFKIAIKDSELGRSKEFYSVQVYQDFNPETFDPTTVYTKIAAVQTSSAHHANLEKFEIPAGKYAVFEHIGPSHTFPETMRAMFAWLKNSVYVLDDRPHFEILGEDYLGPLHPESKETVWLPIK